ncbi:phospholipase A and acyltransferase 3-like [Liolophura sinensis]|uniref:phospholipase A and acyltransferase 3-like n=1 Tax=Liolophura sinensis TaxID=3198878 RepID=UPI003158E963
MASLSTRRHNERVLLELEPGDIIKFGRKVYSHYAVYAGHGRVIHLCGENDGIGDGLQSDSMFSVCGKEFNKAWIREDDFFEVAKKSKAKKNNKDHKYTPIGSGNEVLHRARQRLGRIGYNVLTRNCEHFAFWCRYGVQRSRQVDRFLWAIAGAVGFGVVTLVGAFFGLRNVKRRNALRNANN